MVTGAHPFQHDLVSAQRHQLGTGQSRFDLGYAAEEQNKTATMKKRKNTFRNEVLTFHQGDLASNHVVEERHNELTCFP